MLILACKFSAPLKERISIGKCHLCLLTLVVSFYLLQLLIGSAAAWAKLCIPQDGDENPDGAEGEIAVDGEFGDGPFH